MKTDFYVEFHGEKINYKELHEKAKEIWKEQGKFVKDIISMELYYKPEENNCYYVINDESGYFKV